MINLFAVCKNDRFVHVVARMLKNRGVNLIETCTDPNLAIVKFLIFRPLPDIILLDANWDSRNYCGTQLLQQFLAISDLPPKIILMTNSYDENTVVKSKGLGASGYFYRTAADADGIFQCIKAVYDGGLFFQANEFIVNTC